MKKSQNGVFRQKQLNRWNVFLWAVFFFTTCFLFCFVFIFPRGVKLSWLAIQVRYYWQELHRVFGMLAVEDFTVTSALFGIPWSVHSSFRAALRNEGARITQSQQERGGGGAQQGFPALCACTRGALLFLSCVRYLVCFEDWGVTVFLWQGHWVIKIGRCHSLRWGGFLLSNELLVRNIKQLTPSRYFHSSLHYLSVCPYTIYLPSPSPSLVSPQNTHCSLSFFSLPLHHRATHYIIILTIFDLQKWQFHMIQPHIHILLINVSLSMGNDHFGNQK